MKSILSVMALALFALPTVHAQVDKPQVQTFVRPTLANGNRLDWCAEWSNKCGAEAAAGFCALKGYDREIGFTLDSSPNRTELLTGQICEADYCDGFGMIKCVRDP